MPRTARFIEPKNFYHVISRSLNDTWIFKDNKDFEYFIQLVFTAKLKFPLRLFHYVIMNTHFHFVVQAFDHESISQNLAYLKWHYTLWVRKKYGWKGPLWRERYKSLLIENENYLHSCGTYIEYNPVRAGVCKNPEDYVFSSYKKYCLGIPNTLIDDYEIPQCNGELSQIDYRSKSTKSLFCDSKAIGSSLFIASLIKNACPKK